MKKIKRLFYAELNGGHHCCLVEARTIKAARRYLLIECGRSSEPIVSKATAENEAWVLAFGGMVHSA
jgi:hypothetical protein